MDCPNRTEGYNEITIVETGRIAETLKVWCETCKGRGEVPYDGDRTQNIAWERE